MDEFDKFYCKTTAPPSMCSASFARGGLRSVRWHAQQHYMRAHYIPTEVTKPRPPAPVHTAVAAPVLALLSEQTAEHTESSIRSALRNEGPAH